MPAPKWANQPKKQEGQASQPEYQFNEATGQLLILCDLGVEGRLSQKGKSLILCENDGVFEKIETPWGELSVKLMILKSV
jgi:hypothetical protein